MLNDRERRTLAWIERHLTETDPRLARMFRSFRPPNDSGPTVLLAVGLVVVLLGSVTTLVPIVAIGMACALTALAAAALRQGGLHRPMTA